jgi:hypothetical protein
MFFSYLIFLSFSCKQTPVTNEDNVIKSPLEMSWTADTLSYNETIQTLMSQLLAFSSKDIYAVGWCSLVGGEIYHYNGSSWSPVDVAKYIGGHRINSLFGFFPNNIWGVGYAGQNNLIAHFNGTVWQKEDIFSEGNLLSIDADSPSNIYACGRKATLYYYNGTSWISDFIPVNFPRNTEIQYQSLAVYNGEVFVTGWGKNNALNYYKKFFIKGKFRNWIIVDSLDMNKVVKITWGFDKMVRGKNGKLYSMGPNNIFVWEDNRWKELTTPYNRGAGLYVYNDNYMLSFLTGIDYYDGNKWQGLEKINIAYKNVLFTDGWTDGKELFIVGYFVSDFPQKTLILHGK